MAQPARIASLFGAAVILAIVGPFNTDEAMRALPRLIYWLSIVGFSYTVGYFGNALADRFADGFAKRVAFGVPVTALGVFVVIYLINGLALNFWPTGRELAVVAANVVVISAIISLIFVIVEHSREAEPATADATAPAVAALPPLLDRLPFDKRAALVSLSVEDHYVRIRTTKGEEMLLMRLADAIREVGTTRGLQVHRSHWIALDQVTAATRKGDGAVLSLAHGPDIPVSRANVTKIKEAGLLP